MMRLFIAAVSLLCCSVQAQHLFPEKFNDCVTDHFKLEKDTATIKKPHSEIAEVILRGLKPELRDKLKGDMYLQVIVDTEGRSCLLSVKNETKVATAKLGLKKIVDEQLRWNPADQKYSPILYLNFSGEKDVLVTRLGVGGSKGFLHELRE